MKIHRWIAWFTTLASLVILSTAVNCHAGSKSIPGKTVTMQLRPALALYKSIRNKPGNLCVSPFGVSLSLAVLQAGAKGDTSEEIRRVLSMGTGKEVDQAFGLLLNRFHQLQQSKYIDIGIANALWLQKGFPFEPGFVKGAGTTFHSEAQSVNFSGDANGARQAINTWVSRKTRGLIREGVPGDSINSETRLALTTAVYFKGKWAAPFDRVLTKKEWFMQASGSRTKVPMMHKHYGWAGYMKDAEAQVLEMAYVHPDLTMVVILPKKKNGLKKLETGLTEKRLAQYLKKIQMQDVDISMPRFEISQTLDLKPVLRAMGVVTVWDRKKADLSGISRQKKLFLGSTNHQTRITANEEGVEAAAVVVSGIPVQAAPSEPVVFRSDHPFLYLIRDKATGAILFMGRVVQPG